MKTFLISATVAVALAGMAAQAQASDALANAVQASVELRDGSTLHIFKDGKMAQESRFGRAVYLNVGASVSTKDGRNIAITSNEVARLGSLLQKEHGG